MSGPWIAAFAALWAVVVVLALLMLGLLRRIAPVLEQAEDTLRRGAHHLGGLTPGTNAPTFVAFDEDGEAVEWSAPEGEPVVVLFIEPGCKPCELLLAGLRDMNDDLVRALVSFVPDSPAGHAFASELPGTVLYQREGAASAAFAVSGTPHAFAITAEGTIVAAGVPNQATQLVRLIDAARKGGDTRLRTVSAVS